MGNAFHTCEYVDMGMIDTKTNFFIDPFTKYNFQMMPMINYLLEIYINAQINDKNS